MYVGFSFGGVLAQMVAAQLWLLPHTRTDQLMSNVICITFGQPLIQSLLLTHVAESYPDFKNSVHAIGLKDDNFPSIVERVDSLTIAKKVCILTFPNSSCYGIVLIIITQLLCGSELPDWTIFCLGESTMFAGVL